MFQVTHRRHLIVVQLIIMTKILKNRFLTKKKKKGDEIILSLQRVKVILIK
jgi:hypothetical protein